MAKGTLSNGNIAKKEKKKTKCKICSNSFAVILTHLNKSEECKKRYGKEYERLKAAKMEEKKKYLANYKLRNEESIRQSNSQYHSKNKENLREKARLRMQIKR